VTTPMQPERAARASSPASELRLETLGDLGEFEAIAPEWDTLVRQMTRPSPFLLHAWLHAWLRHYGAGKSQAIHVARREGSLVAALPLAVHRRAGLRVASFAGGDVIFGDALLREGEPPSTIEALLQHARGHHDLACLLTIEKSSRLVQAAGSRLRLFERVAAPVMEVTNDFDEAYRRNTSSRARSNHKRRRRQIAELGRVELPIARTPSELAEALEDVFRLHTLRWHDGFDRSNLQTDLDRAFHREALAGVADADIARILRLCVDGEAIAFVYYFVFCSRMYLFRLAYDPGFGRFSPGLVSVLAAIEQASREGIETIEFLRGAERYKVELADRVDTLYQAVGLCGSLRGAALSSLLSIWLNMRGRLKRSSRLRRLYLERLGPLARRLRRPPSRREIARNDGP
jgi:CelD/BcsL family acetyltransferase involved in cellulose biosynthesis